MHNLRHVLRWVLILISSFCSVHRLIAEHPTIDWQTYSFAADEADISYNFGLFPYARRGSLSGTLEIGIDHETSFLRNIELTATNTHWIEVHTGDVVELEEFDPGPLVDGAPLVDVLLNDIRDAHGSNQIRHGKLTTEFSVTDECCQIPVIIQTTLSAVFSEHSFFDSEQIQLSGSSSSINIADGPSVQIDHAIGQLLTIPIGDFNRDGLLNGLDIDLLTSQIESAIYDGRFDVNLDHRLDEMDRSTWVKGIKNTWYGDVNLDGEFNSSDLVSVFQAGEYEDGHHANSNWSTGDWNADREFDSGDLVVAFQDGGFEMGPQAAVSSVPEPAAIVLVFTGLMFFARRNKMHATVSC